jgi:arylsulfatase A-like enzyme/Flp pilus assembly protein TadD
MPHRRAARPRPWHATLIVSLFFVAVAGAAAVGWWYARESPPHQGPIVLISLAGAPATSLTAYGAQGPGMPGVDALASEAVVFERAYTHSTQTLPAHASLLSGRLPLEHGVRDDAGFALGDDVRTLAELLRNRGFTTGAAVSSFLLRRETGVAQGFSFFDGELPAAAGAEAPAVERDGAGTVDAAERWMKSQRGQRFFLFLQVGRDNADAAVTRVSGLLKDRGLYDDATILIVGDRGDTGSGTALDDQALHIPLFVKQPDNEGAGRRINLPVQHIDLLPTILDLVRAPLPGGLRGRSLRAMLDDDEAQVPARPIYSESLAALFRLGGTPAYAVTDERYRLVRGAAGEEIVPLSPAPDDAGAAMAAETARLRAALDELFELRVPPAETPPVAPADEERYALLGYLPALRLGAAPSDTAERVDQAALVEAHREAAILIGHKRYSAGIRALQAIVRDHPSLAVVHYQLGAVLARTGRLEEAVAAFRTARELRPEALPPSIALADTLMRAGEQEAALIEAERAVMLASTADGRGRAQAHEIAARVALAGGDGEAATRHAEAAQLADPALPIVQFVRGRLLYDEGKYEDAAAALTQAEAAVRDGERQVADLHFFLGESLIQLDRYADAEAQYRQELRAFPRNVQAYTSLAMLYRASNRDAAIEDVLNELVAATPTPEGYAVAARLWTIVGDRSRAEALRSDARARFRGDPSLALLGRDGRR